MQCHSHHQRCWQPGINVSTSLLKCSICFSATIWEIQFFSWTRIEILNDIVFPQRRAACDGIDALSMRDYVSRYISEYPELMDLVAADDTSSNRAVQNNLTAAQYSPHLPLDTILSGVKSRQLFRGTIHPSGENWTMCYVILHNAESAAAGQRSVKIIGRSVMETCYVEVFLLLRNS